MKVNNDIAIIGMGAHYPGALDIKTLWENIISKREQFRLFPDERLPIKDYTDLSQQDKDKSYVTQGAFIDGFEFDWLGYRIPKKTIESSDIVHWLTYEVAQIALKDAGYTKQNIAKDKTAVILGNTLTGEETRTSYLRQRWPYVERVMRSTAKDLNLTEEQTKLFIERSKEYYISVFPEMTEDSLAGGLANTIAGRVCNTMDLHGGGYTVDGACSSSLIAVSTAAEKLSSGVLDMAIAGGVDVSLDTFEMVGFARTGALTPDKMRVYDKRGNGFMPGEGCGLVVMKRLEDARRDGDKVYAVIKGWGMSSDGKGGMTAPNGTYQGLALQRAYEMAGYSAKTLDFIEGHGTGTTVGDREELKGVALNIGVEPKNGLRSCGITSFKSISGHTKAASGIAGLIKVALSLNQRIVPPTAGCEEPNLSFNEPEGKGVYPILLGEVREPNTQLRAGVSAMGFGGINTHITLESGDAPFEEIVPELSANALLVTTQKTEIFPLSANSVEELTLLVEKLKEEAFGMSNAELPDLAAAVSQRVNDGKVKATIITDHPNAFQSSLSKLIAYLKSETIESGKLIEVEPKSILVSVSLNKSKLAFIYPGQGSQKINMAYGLVNRFEWAKEMLNEADNVLKEAGWKDELLSSFIYKPTDKALDKEQEEAWLKELTNTNIAQPAICFASAVWTERLRRLGIKAHSTGGHSLGELSAFSEAGAFDYKSLISLAELRGDAMHRSESKGSMVAVLASLEKVKGLLSEVDGYLTIANINSPEQIVVSGEESAIDKLIELSEKREIRAKKLNVSNAFHSKLVDEASKILHAKAPVPKELNAKCDIISAVTTKKVEAKTDLVHYFGEQVLNQVDFVGLISEMSKECDMFVEVGTGKILSGMISYIDSSIAAFPVEADVLDDFSLNNFLAHYFVSGGVIDWSELYDSRLIRDFTPASQKKFIESACEKPFDLDPLPLEAQNSFNAGNQQDHTIKNQVSNASLTDVINTLQLINDSKIIDAVNLLGAGNSFNSKIIVPETPSVITQNIETVEVAKSEPKVVAPVKEKESGSKNVFLNKLADMTGFPVESLELDLKLLDDLNLDSIKATELIVETTQELGLEIELDPATLANARLEEIIAVFDDYLGDATDSNSVSSKATLYKNIEKMTGFPSDTLALDLKLLDDLNLDSIKATELIVETTQELGLEIELDPSTLANATLEEIIAVFDEHLGEVSSNESSDTLAKDTLYKNIEKMTGFPTDTLELDLKLLDDLNLDSIKATELIVETTQELGLEIELDPSALANASLEEIIAVLNENLNAENKQGSKTKATSKTNFTKKAKGKKRVQPWVRNFIMTPTVEELNNEISFADKSRVLVVAEKRENTLVSQLNKALEAEKNVELVTLRTFDELKENKTLLDESTLEYIFVILPQEGSQKEDSASVNRMIERLSTVSTLKADTTVCFVQFAGGLFGTNDSVLNIEQSGTLAWASSLHLEQKSLKIRVIDFPKHINGEFFAQQLMVEASTSSSFSAAGYTANMKRQVFYPEVQTRLDKSSNIKWSGEDVILVTGGAKGITAECALSFAQYTGAKMALLGSSKRPNPNEDNEINDTLNKFKKLNLDVVYYACNLVDKEDIKRTISEIEAQQGAVTAVVHGAGLNNPAPLSYVSEAKAKEEVAPKVQGAINILEAFEEQPLKMFTALTSIIGVSGMIGNGWYGFSNEVLDILVAQYGNRHPSTKTVSIAYSVWGETGMGAKMGSTDYLEKMGIMAIPTVDGVDRFLEMVLFDAPARQVVVTAKLEGLDTWRVKPLAKPYSNRYLEKIVYEYPHVNVIAEAHLTIEKDPYLKDHVWKGSNLFPTVFGLESMAQVVAYMMEIDSFKNLKIENIKLDRPIVVNDNKGTRIQINAQALERNSSDKVQKVKVSISTEQSQFQTEHFAATFVLDGAGSFAKETKGLPLYHKKRLDVDVKKDMYSWLLFQGERFQRLVDFYQIDNDTTVFNSLTEEEEEREWMLGSPYVRDSLLQSVQPMVPQHTCLPVSIDAIYIDDASKALAQKVRGVAFNEALVDEEYRTSVYALESAEHVYEKLEGYRLKILDYRKDFPNELFFAKPAIKDEPKVVDEIKDISGYINIIEPKVMMKYIPSLSKMSREERHEIMKPLIDSWLEKEGVEATLSWKEGKPTLEGSEYTISLSHSNSYLFVHLCLSEAAGCDIEEIVQRPTEQWESMLQLNHANYQELVAHFKKEGDNEDVASTRLWSIRESIFKAIGEFNGEIDVSFMQDGLSIVRIESEENPLLLVSLRVSVARGSDHIITFVAQGRN